MANNIILHAIYGRLDLRHEFLGRPDIPMLWELLLADKRPVEKRELMCGEICRDEGRTEWMHVYERQGRRIAAHQSVEAERRHQTNESDEHKAYKERTVRVAESAGHVAEAEVRSVDGKIRSDVLVYGVDKRPFGFEIQRSLISAQTVTRRDRLAAATGIYTAWHTDQRDLSLRNEVPWTRTDNLSPGAIADGRDLLIRSGVRRLTPYRCDYHEPTVCPTRRSGRCGLWHFRPDVLTLHYDEYVRRVAAGQLVKVAFGLGRRANMFWVPVGDRDRYESSQTAAAAIIPAEARSRNEATVVAGSPTCRTRGPVEAETTGPEPIPPRQSRAISAACCGARWPGLSGEPIVLACQLCPAAPTYWRAT